MDYRHQALYVLATWRCPGRPSIITAPTRPLDQMQPHSRPRVTLSPDATLRAPIRTFTLALSTWNQNPCFVEIPYRYSITAMLYAVKLCVSPAGQAPTSASR